MYLIIQEHSELQITAEEPTLLPLVRDLVACKGPSLPGQYFPVWQDVKETQEERSWIS